jgi:microcystin-dependent protein
MGNITIPETLYDGTLFTKKLMYNLNFVNDKIWVSANAPVLPIPGQLWWDSDASTFAIWTGAVWYQIYPASIGGTLVKISANDTTANYLIAKLVAGTGVVLTELNDGGDEDLEVKIGQAVATTDSPVFAGLTINGNIIVTGTVDGLDLQSHNHSGANQGGTVNHVDLVNIGSNSHVQIDTHIADGTIHFLESTINHLNIQNIGSNSHAQIDAHIVSTSNPHSVTYAQVGAIQDIADVIKDTHIDWGLGANQVSAVDIPIEDTGGYFSSSDVEGALQELGASGGFWTRDSGNGYLYPTTLTDKIGIGTNVPDEILDVKGKMHIWDEGPNNVGHIRIKSYYQSNGCGGISMWRARGTKASPGNLLPDDYVGVIEFKPYYLDNWLNSADILVQVLSPALSGSPSRMRFRTVRDGDVVPDEKFRIEPNSVVFNYDKKNYDFEIKGDNNDYVLFVDASADKVAIGMNTPNEILTLEGALSMDELGTSPTVSPGYGKVYCKTDQKIYYKDSSDVEHDLLATVIPSGLIAMWSGTIATIPSGWALCDGTSGRPDLRASFVRGAPAAQDPGNTGGSDTHTLTESEIPGHTHSIGTESSHTHSWSTTSTGNHRHSISDSGSHKHQHKAGDGAGPDANIVLQWSGYGWRDDTQNWAGNHNHGANTGYQTHSHSGTTGSGSTHSHSCGSTGGGQPHNNMPAYYEVAFIIKV